jgi:hypothetical protein
VISIGTIFPNGTEEENYADLFNQKPRSSGKNRVDMIIILILPIMGRSLPCSLIESLKRIGK